MQTKLSYFEDSYQFSSNAKVLSCEHDENGPYILLDSTIFHPQGGGQPSDLGRIQVEESIVDVVMVRSKEGQVRHYTKEIPVNIVGKKALLVIDENMRCLASRLHTAGHALSLAVETLNPHLKAVKGHHYPECPYVEFVLQGEGAAFVSLEAVNKEIERLITEQHAIEAIIVGADELQKLCPSVHTRAFPIRLVRIGPFAYQPCGGTHVKNSTELHGLSASKQKAKGTTLRVSYEIIHK